MAFESEVAALAEVFPDVVTSNGGAATLVRIPSVQLPVGCTPTNTPVLLELQENARPVAFVRPGIRLPNGATPRSTSEVLKNGETWLQFSFQFPWDISRGLVVFVGAALQRFALHE